MVPYQAEASRFPDIPQEEFARSVVLVSQDGFSYRAAEAVFRALTYGDGFFNQAGWWCYENIPGFRFLSEGLYKLVAAHRIFFSRLTRMLWGANPSHSTYRVSTRLYLRFLALIYAAAFASLLIQVTGLIGTNGIMPAHEYLASLTKQVGWERFWFVPTVFWFGAGNTALLLACAAGIASSAALLFGLAPVICLVMNWVLYLSLVSVSGDFLRFQWDALLLEAGFISIFLAPPVLRDSFKKPAPSPAPVVHFLIRWLLFRLMFSSGMVKIFSRDITWNRLEALRYHYETQPLPTWIGWFAHQAPGWFHRDCAIGMFFLELAVPFFLFLPRRPRTAAVIGLISLQVMIGLTGNYAFFNYLTIALCFLMVDDQTWPGAIRRRAGGFTEPPPREIRPFRLAVVAIPAFLFLLSGYVFTTRILGWKWPATVEKMGLYLSPYELSNPYGLFAVMTTQRPEIIMEGSRDGRTWLAYEFHYKPGPLKKRPAFVAPHQPRLDWQMWFAALGNYQQSAWFVPFCQRLLEGTPEVTALLKRNPFPDAPPRYIRSLLYDYRFTHQATRSETGAWWRRENPRIYAPTFSLNEPNDRS